MVKIKMKSDGSKKIKNGAGHAWIGHGFGCTPTQSNVQLLPKNMNKPFIKRFLEWWK
jgi:hypothetical protein